MNYPNNILQKLDFDQILELTTKKCLTKSGQQIVSELQFLDNYKTIEKELSIVDEMREILVLDYNFPFSYFDDLSNIFDKLDVEDVQVDIVEIVAVKKFLDVLRLVLRFFQDEKHKKFTHLVDLSTKPKVHQYVSEQINAVINNKGMVRDNASPELNSIRKSLKTKKIEVSKRLNSIYAKIKQSGWLDADISVTMVNGRLVVPIDSSHKRKITGLVHDVSSTGKTSYIEPSDVLNLNNELVDLEYHEKQEVKRIIKQLCDNIRPYISDLREAFNFMSMLDMYRAKAKFAIDVNAIKPAVYQEPQISIANARHPLLYLTLKREDKEVVPLNIRFQDKERIAVISGPNAGGKSVALKTVGLLQLMLQYGFLLPVGGGSEMGVFDKVFIDMGDEQSMDNDLSTYSSHLLNMKHFLKNCNSKTLILIDEFGTGTEPKIGGAIAESVLEELNKTETFGVITTHYSNLKHLAASKEGLINAAMMFDNQKMQALFQLELRQAGSSFAFEIARKIGLPETVLDLASSKVGKEQVDFDKHLREVLRDKKYWNEKRYKIRKEEKTIDGLVEELSIDSQEIKSIRKKAIKEAKLEAEQILNQVNKKVENTIKKIREAQAEKETTKAIRKEFEDFKKEIITGKERIEEDKILRKIDKLKHKQKKAKVNEPKKVEKTYVPTELKIGSKVKVKSSRTVGEILEIKNSKVLLSVGDMRMKLDISQLEYLSSNEFKKHLPKKKTTNTVLFTDSTEKKLHFRAHLDLRGKRVDEALSLLTRFIDDAIATDTKELKVLHGTGTGALRSAIRQYLKTINLVTHYKDERLEMGGAGITIVSMSK